ncbi:uncharacterized protein PHALS_14209 [Plasmopara halstedii]|uniref:Uncharacterized protein n=1 Tax=Plasmopara halstedii TaxID=4781 RepID=A0A0P1AT41_PLAHL|nr:uncharacterized protein PHALS_14209 [Plasmopara halstedii]CEG43928.1 hypothetical protein PHALS_14209 [Plasmopara halstedii]|eukprot:XP_024580297.1 hypothetical protein PHALS_14209 [Plasmopara halstedii]
MSTQHFSRPPHLPYRLVVNRHRSHPRLGLIALRRAGRLRRAVDVPVLFDRAVCGLVGGGMKIFTTRVPAFELAWSVGLMGIGKLPKPTRIPFRETTTQRMGWVVGRPMQHPD